VRELLHRKVGEKGRAKIRYLKSSVIAWQEQLL
jgi:hypothetical protein